MLRIGSWFALVGCLILGCVPPTELEEPNAEQQGAGGSTGEDTLDPAEAGSDQGGTDAVGGGDAVGGADTAGAAGTNTSLTLVLQPGTDGQDAHVVYRSDGGDATKNYGGEDSLLVTAWNEKTSPTDPGNVRIRSWGLLRFSLSLLPSNAVVTRARLFLYANPEVGPGPELLGQIGHSTLSGDNSFWIETVLGPWDESSVTFQTIPQATVHRQPQSSSAEAMHFPGTTVFNQDLTLEVTELVLHALTRNEIYYGFLIHLDDETEFRKLRFASSEHADETKHPRLEIEYALPSE